MILYSASATCIIIRKSLTSFVHLWWFKSFRLCIVLFPPYIHRHIMCCIMEWSNAKWHLLLIYIFYYVCVFFLHFSGKNNGTVQGTSYFSCKPKHGVFVRHDRLYLDKKRTNKTFPATKVVLNKPPTTPPASKPTAASTPSYLKPTRASRVRKN